MISLFFIIQILCQWQIFFERDDKGVSFVLMKVISVKFKSKQISLKKIIVILTLPCHPKLVSGSIN